MSNYTSIRKTKEATSWIPKLVVNKRSEMVKFVENLSQKDYELLELLIKEVRENMVNDIISQIDNSPFMKMVKHSPPDFILVKAPSFRLM